VTPHHTSPASIAALLLVGLAAHGLLVCPAAVAADKTSDPLPRRGFTCCNLHHEADWINDGNYASLPMIPVGSPATVENYGRQRANVEIDGKKMRLGHDYGREQESLEQWVHKIIVDEDPKPKIAAFPLAIREAIGQGKVMVGMTREQVIMAVGYPLTSETPSLDSTLWRHWISSFGEYQLLWGSDGKIKEIAGDETTRNVIVYKPGN
jgi:hypothetical protein